MKCKYKLSNEEEWRSGEIVSIGGTDVNFCSRDKKRIITHQLTLTNPETLYFGEVVSVTGWRSIQATENLYQLVSVDVKFH